MKATIEKLEVYPFFLVVLVGKDKGEIQPTLQKLDIPITTEEVNDFIQDPQDKGFSIKLDYVFDDDGYERSVFLIWLRQRPTNNQWFSITAHESLHITHQILHHIGQETIPFDDDEVMVYLFDYIFEKVLDIARRK